MAKVAYILNAFPQLSETFILNEILELQRQNVEVYVYSINKPDVKQIHETSKVIDNVIYFEDLNNNSINKVIQNVRMLLLKPFRYVVGLLQVIKMDSGVRWNYTRVAEIGRDILKKDIQHIHAHYASVSAECAMCVSMMTGITFSFTTHGYDVFFEPHRHYSTLGLKAKNVIAVSNFNRNYISDRYNIDVNKIKVVHCGIDTDMFTANGDHNDKSIDMITVARLHPVKGLDYLIEACRILKENMFELKCVIVGDGEEKNKLLELISTYGLNDNVILVGGKTQGQVLRYLQKSKMYVMPSVSEAMPVAPMEALSCGVPVIASNVRGVSELVRDAVNGFLVEARNSAMLAEKILLLLNNAELRTSMGMSGRKIILEEFRLKSEVGKLMTHFGIV